MNILEISQNRFKQFSHVLNNWLFLRQRGKSLFQYFEDNEIKKIAIYGMGMLGERLYDELKNTSVEVVYAIDRMAGSRHYENLEIYGLENTHYLEVDAVIITPVQEYWNIAAMMEKKLDAPMLSLEDVVMYCISVMTNKN